MYSSTPEWRICSPNKTSRLQVSLFFFFYFSVCDTLPQVQVQHNLSPVLLCVGLHTHHLRSLSTQHKPFNKVKEARKDSLSLRQYHQIYCLRSRPCSAWAACIVPTLIPRVPHYFLGRATFPGQSADFTTARTHLVSDVDLGEAESLQMNAGGADGRSRGLHQQLLQILANKGPSLLDDLCDKTRGYYICPQVCIQKWQDLKFFFF